MHRRSIVSSFLLLLVLCMATAPEAVAQENAEKPAEKADVDTQYKTLTKQAAKAYRQKQYKDALELFKQAYALKQIPNLLYNMGRIQEKRGEFDAAIGHYEDFVTKPGVDIKARRDALERLRTLREVVALRQEGEDVDKKQITEQHEDRELAEAEQEERTPEVSRNYVPAYVTLGAAVAAYATSGYFALRAREANSDFESAETRALRRDAASRGETAAIVADSTLAAGVILTGVSAYFFLSPPTEEVPPDQSAMQLSPRLDSDGAGVSFSMTF